MPTSVESMVRGGHTAKYDNLSFLSTIEVGPKNWTTRKGVCATVYERIPCPQSGHGERDTP